MHQAGRLGVAVLLTGVLAGCSLLPASSCPAGQKPLRQAQLFFGRAIPGGGEVSEEAWKQFLADDVTPRFPDGLTVVDAAGQWKDATGVVHEPSKLVIVILSGASEDEARLEAVRQSYRRRFHQESVLLVETHVCGSF